MKKVFFFEKFPRSTLLLTTIVFLVVIAVLVELILKSVNSYRIATIGHQECENARLYGWGFSPHEPIRRCDPDTGVSFVSPANNHGWRDLDRQYDNKKGAYRILVLGDSTTFGAIVPADKTYTRILEKKLSEKGYNCEVINMAYGSWSTDQELEALKNEGLKYRPNLIIVQFCRNDLNGNTYFYSEPDKAESPAKLKWKPFYYRLDNGVLKRKENPYFSIGPDNPKTLKGNLRNLIQSSEMLKRIYAVYLFYRLHESPASGYPDMIAGSQPGIKYRITQRQPLQLETVIGLKKESPLHKYLNDNIGKTLRFNDLNRVIESSGYDIKQKNIILRVLEHRSALEGWGKKYYFPQYADIKSYEWRLYLSLVAEIKKYARSIGADVIIFPETEEGAYQWDMSWYRVSGDPVSKTNYLSNIQVIKRVMKSMGIGVVDNTIPYRRARNDPHPNIEGNEAMAEDIFNYIMAHKKSELEAYKNVVKR